MKYLNTIPFSLESEANQILNSMKLSVPANNNKKIDILDSLRYLELAARKEIVQFNILQYLLPTEYNKENSKTEVRCRVTTDVVDDEILYKESKG